MGWPRIPSPRRAFTGSAYIISYVSPSLPSAPASTSGPYMKACTVGSSGIACTCRLMGKLTSRRSPFFQVRSTAQ